MTNNSSGLQLSGLDDHINPSLACIIPKEKIKDFKSEISKPKVNIELEDFKMDSLEDTKMEKVEISLTDCLACSGCITSAETILISLQSNNTLLKLLKENEQTLNEKKSFICSISPQVISSFSSKYNIEYNKMKCILVGFLKNNLGIDFVLDISVAKDLALLENLKEFLIRREAKDHLPVLASACPGWICYAEKTQGFILDNIAKTKSPQQIMGTLIKSFFSKEVEIAAENIYHLTIMSCYDKKLEASREDFYNDLYQGNEVDLVLTTIELEKMLIDFNHISNDNTTFQCISPVEMDTLFASKKYTNYEELTREVLSNENHNYWLNYGLNPTNYSFSNSFSDAYLEYLILSCSEILFGNDQVWNLKEFYNNSLETEMPAKELNFQNLKVKSIRNSDFREVSLIDENNNELIKMASAYGFRNIQNVVRKIKNSNRIQSNYDYIEIMACPSGCINGGGQLKNETLPLKQWLFKMKKDFKSSLSNTNNNIRLPHQNPWLKFIYLNWLNCGDIMQSNELSKRAFHTQYHQVEQLKDVNVLGLGSSW